MIVKGEGHLGVNPAAVLLIQMGDIGDVVLSLPCVRALREHFPQARLVVAVRDKAAALFDDCPWVNGVISIRQPYGGAICSLRYQIDFLRRLRSFRCDLAIDLRTGTRGAVMAYLSGAGQRIGFYACGETFWRNWLFTDLYLPEPAPKIYIAEYLQNLLVAYGISLLHPVPVLPVALTGREAAWRLFHAAGVDVKKPIIALQPFSLWRYKELAEAKIVTLIRFMRQRGDLQVVVTGTAAERERVEALVSGCGVDAVYNLAGDTSLGQLAAMLQCCALFVGMDSAGLHLAAAVGIRTVGIFGPSSPESWAPRGVKHLVVQKNFPCVPCREKGCGGSEKSKCLEELQMEEIMQAMERQLAGLTADGVLVGLPDTSGMA